MVRTGQHNGLARSLDKFVTSVLAHVVIRLERPVARADNDDVLVHHLGGDVVSGLRKLAAVSAEPPVPIEDGRLLRLMNSGIMVEASGNCEGLRRVRTKGCIALMKSQNRNCHDAVSSLAAFRHIAWKPGSAETERAQVRTLSGSRLYIPDAAFLLSAFFIFTSCFPYYSWRG